MPDLGLDITSLVRPGRRPVAAEGAFVRELTPADFALLAVPGSTQPIHIKKIGERHHALARALALGMKDSEAAAITGYDPARISVLKQSPAFQELLSLYRDDATRQFQDVAARLAGLAHDAVVELQHRLEESPEEISVGQLVEISKMAADRSGHGPSSKQEVTVNVSMRERIEAARQRALARNAPIIEDAQYVEVGRVPE